MVQDNSPASPVDEAFEELFEVIPELKMFASVQVVPGGDSPDPDKSTTGSLSLEEARMYKSEPDLRFKYEATETANPCPFGDVSHWLQCSMQLGDLRQPARDPFISARDPRIHQEQIQREMIEGTEWRPPVLPAMALIRQESPSEIDRMLISQAQNMCQQGRRRDPPSESQCKVFMPSFWDAQLVNDPEPWYDHLEVDGRENAFPCGLRQNLFKFDSAANSPARDPDMLMQTADSDIIPVQERDSESPDSVSSIDSIQDLVITPNNPSGPKPIDSRPFRNTEPNKFVMHKNHKTTFKSGRPRLCQFLFELLDNPEKYAYMIEWLDKDKGVFKFVNSGEVARLWGRRRNKPSMKYENFARSLRTYIAKGILTKPRSKLVYQFATTRN